VASSHGTAPTNVAADLFSKLHRELMSKTNRRLRKIARGYADLVAKGDLAGFHRAWDQRMRGWLYDIDRRRMNSHYQSTVPQGEQQDKATMDSQYRARIFEVLDASNHLLAACGEAVERLVGEETRATLKSECANAVASIYDRRLYRPLSGLVYKRNS
jgi:hypothetical protein